MTSQPGIRNFRSGPAAVTFAPVRMNTMSDESAKSAPEAARSSDELANRRIGDFLLIRRLGSGGMADVYLAEQTSLARSVAIKILKAETLAAPSAEVLLKRFEQEARAAGGLSHPNIVQVYMTGQDDDLRYIVQEYVPGLNLSQWIRRHGSPDYGTGLRWMQDIASALHAAAEAGVIHRDIKPENIMITRSGVAKVTDFGLAQLTQHTSPQMNLTQVGTTMGTPWYMSPEQIQGEQLDHRSDQYSFGITCYHMFAGEPPFPGRNAVTVAVQHLKEDPVPLSKQRQDLPLPLCEVIHKMMAKRPEDRYQAFGELESALGDLSHVPVRTRLGRARGWLGHVEPFLPDRRAALIVGGLLLIASLAVGRRLQQPIRLPETAAEVPVPRETSAPRQYAVAMLSGNRASDWKAVIDYYPNSPEADVARIRLGLAYMSSSLPNYRQAMAAFHDAEDQGRIAIEKQWLQILGIAGQAYVLSVQQDREAGFELLERAYEEFGEETVNETIQAGPEELAEQIFRERFPFGRSRRDGRGRP